MKREFKPGDQALFVVSLDTESAWGMFEMPGGLRRYKAHYDHWQENVELLVQLLERYGIKATWDIVGHLFLDECKPEQGVLHSSVVMPEYRDEKKNWRLSADPGTNRAQDPWWYGKNIVERIRNVVPQQEIATHTFSHMIMDRPECTKEVARSELQACLDLARNEGIVLETIVFPHNRVAHLPVVRELGVKAFRGLEQRFYYSYPRPLQRFFVLLEKIVMSAPPVYPLSGLRYKEGVLEIPASMFLFTYDGFIKKAIPPAWRFLQAKKGMERAVRERAIFHLWLHPYNLGSSEHMVENVESILRLARKFIDEGKMKNATMRETRLLYEELGKTAQ